VCRIQLPSDDKAAWALAALEIEGSMMAEKFTAGLWDGISDIYHGIITHPFVTGLTDGSLPPESFAYYVVQDALFLPRYAQALAAVASRAPDAAVTEMLVRHAAGIITAEMSLHEWIFAELDVDHAAAEEAPTTLAYTSFLLASTLGGSYAEGIGAVLPCYWIYWEVGKHLMRLGSPNAGYQRWIDTYGGEEYASDVREMIDAADALSDLAPIERDKVQRRFRASSRYEWMFWDMGFRQDDWPGLQASEHP
jgi:thiaminase (transcriptional activator TenA)